MGCTHDCESCGSDCNSKDNGIQTERLNDYSSVKKVIGIVSGKGGVGKTTSAVNIAAAIGALGKKTLLVDMDPQGNATSGVGISKKSVTKSAYDLILNDLPFKSVVKKTKYKKLDILPILI